ncbi:MAG: AfsR/SARP family transcriptional regulator, partial [Acidimicrobiia bacterium]
MQIQVLGSVEANNGTDIALGGPTQKRILAMLALDAGEVVSVDRLVDAIWTEDALPANPERNIRSCV